MQSHGAFWPHTSTNTQQDGHITRLLVRRTIDSPISVLPSCHTCRSMRSTWPPHYHQGASHVSAVRVGRAFARNTHQSHARVAHNMSPADPMNTNITHRRSITHNADGASNLRSLQFTHAKMVSIHGWWRQHIPTSMSSLYTLDVQLRALPRTTDRTHAVGNRKVGCVVCLVSGNGSDWQMSSVYAQRSTRFL